MNGGGEVGDVVVFTFVHWSTTCLDIVLAAESCSKLCWTITVCSRGQDMQPRCFGCLSLSGRIMVQNRSSSDSRLSCQHLYTITYADTVPMPMWQTAWFKRLEQVHTQAGTMSRRSTPRQHQWPQSRRTMDPHCPRRAIIITVLLSLVGGACACVCVCAFYKFILYHLLTLSFFQRFILYPSLFYPLLVFLSFSYIMHFNRRHTFKGATWAPFASTPQVSKVELNYTDADTSWQENANNIAQATATPFAAFILTRHDGLRSSVLLSAAALLLQCSLFALVVAVPRLPSYVALLASIFGGVNAAFVQGKYVRKCIFVRVSLYQSVFETWGHTLLPMCDDERNSYWRQLNRCPHYGISYLFQRGSKREIHRRYVCGNLYW